jgi:GNAT superfamily N-acetyltransferase
VIRSSAPRRRSTPAVQISVVHTKDLPNFASTISKEPKYRDVAPITNEIALSLVNNPFVEPDDPALFIAYVDGFCAGYMGLLPGRLSFHNQESRVFWGISFYVAREFRKMGVGVLLIKKVLSLDIDFVGDNPSKESSRIWRALGLMDHIRPTTYSVLSFENLRCSSKVIPILQRWARKNRRGKLLYPLLLLARTYDRVAYPFVKYLLYSFVIHTIRSKTSGTFRELNRINRIANVGEQVSPSSGVAEFVRGKDWINWKLQYPWFCQGGGELAEPYYFVSKRKLYRSFGVGLFSGNSANPEGFYLAVASQKSAPKPRILKISEAHGFNDQHRMSVSKAILKHARAYSIDRLELTNELAGGLANHLLARQFLSNVKRHYVSRPSKPTSPLAQAAPHLRPDFSDGHHVIM